MANYKWLVQALLSVCMFSIQLLFTLGVIWILTGVATIYAPAAVICAGFIICAVAMYCRSELNRLQRIERELR